MSLQTELEELCEKQGHPNFEVIVKTYKRSSLHGQPVQVRCVLCKRRWPVMTKDSWVPQSADAA